MARIYNKIRISQDNNQLLDIFYNSSYLELGNIDYEILKKLLKKKVMNINEVVNFNIQNIGVGASKVSNEQVKSLIPYIFFDSITLKDHSVQLFLTHGLLSYRNKENKELFAPLILIPIILTFSYENVYMQVIGEPIENRRLISYLIDNYNIKISMSEKLNTVYQLDRFCMQFERFDNMDVRVENYLTYATITYPQIVINHDKFSLKSLNNNLNYTNINNISPLSQKQMIALDRARSGNSFAITGYLGTGKTTTLINIACDGYSRGQKVLYVSNNRDTLNNIYSIFHNNGLDSILIDLTRSFSRFYANSFDAPEEDENNEQILLDSYNQINDYEKLLSLRILNFRFLDVLKNKFLIEEPEEEIELDDLSNLYKHEYDEIIHSLEVIQSKMVKLEGTFKESKFKNIPINHNIKYPNQIISLLFQIHKSFSELSLNSKILINDYGFKTIPNYAKLRNIITDFNNLDVSKVPDSWKDINNFKLATVKFNDLKNLIYTVQELELYLDWDYQNLETINIEEEINNIINPYFSINETSKINKLLENHHKIITRLHTANLSATNYLKAQIKIKEFLDWEFTDSDNAIEEIIRLTNYLNENFIHKRWLNINNYEINRKKIISLQNKLSHYYDLLNLYHKYFNNIDYLKANITRLSNYQKTGKKLKKYRNVDLNDLIAKFKELRSLQKSINKINDDYYELVGKYYNPNYDIIIDYDNFYKYLISIINSDYRYKIIK
ncbi:MAG TPA: hypothetical protein GXZ48_02650, partial [Acholeplasmataceae bacterium]|nr:hypothetical protein [Acholeplasmataceae bacterium]